MSDDPLKKADMSYKRNRDDRLAHYKGRKAVEQFINFAQDHIVLKNIDLAFVTLDSGSQRHRTIHQLQLKGISFRRTSSSPL
jgi:hypothetical protein